ncbi:fungal-specific transcription factor domain-containing protein [Aspergillus pseudotamarii]|uniref:Fungal-specific transcription factor domain-containing protein n=1 Tax=Aspergillus pseudotamarii TaxID=132259 RepID=A0A5N6T9K5_ASPPS|nr:fungal-specific transcription factor domain-containing protein [Aspergillus pseudotamarii]KAE8142993.1 fungal-specific transcription factor domain-containing protein [Aspergillus pseudotamarii]
MVSKESRWRRRPLLRVKTGCLTCRARKKKCDEGKPDCCGCIRNKLRCRWQSADMEESRKASGSSAATQHVADGLSDDTTPATPKMRTGEDAPTRSGGSSRPPSTVTARSSPEIQETAVRPSTPSLAAQLHEPLLSRPTFMPQLDPARFELFGYYIQTTANSMANGASISNPFIVQLVPLALYSDLILESILCQSSAHRAIRGSDSPHTEAIRLYNKSLRSLRMAINNVVAPTQVDLLSLTVSVLIMCFTETARGDTNGTVFDHLLAARSLVPRVLTRRDIAIPNELRNFLLEYYVYTATTSLISIDAQFTPQFLLCAELLQEGQALATSGYLGSLCGCWLGLLLFVPRIFDLRRTWLGRGRNNVVADQVTTYATIHSEITQWEPHQSARYEVALAGHIYQQATLLYLYTILDTAGHDAQGIHATTIQGAVTKAMLYLDQLPPTRQINTSLCWPIAVVGSCVTCRQQQDKIRIRLNTMSDTIGLGNIVRTRDILEHMWSGAETGPWELSKAMQTAEIWISFA